MAGGLFRSSPTAPSCDIFIQPVVLSCTVYIANQGSAQAMYNTISQDYGGRYKTTTVGESQNDLYESLNKGFTQKPLCLILSMGMSNNRIQSSMWFSETTFI